MTSPYPGWTAPNPRTWAAGDLISVPRLRGDMSNFAALMAGGRPMLNIQQLSGATSVPTATLTLIGLETAVLNTWGVPAVIDPVTPQPYYTVPLAGWYLCQGSVGLTNEGAASYKYVTGIQAVQNSTTTNSDGASVPGNAAGGTNINGAACELLQLNPLTIDTVAVYAFQTTGISITAAWTTFTVEWVGLPSQGSGLPAPTGTVVASPAAAANFPSGQGTFITNGGGISAGATSMTVSDATGMIVNGTLGLDYINGQQFTNTAETVTITSVAGTTIGISATSYAHLQNAPVAVPVSYAFLNQQCRDLIRFLAYPPMLRMQATTTQSVGSTTFPAGTQIIHLSTATGGHRQLRRRRRELLHHPGRRDVLRLRAGVPGRVVDAVRVQRRDSGERRHGPVG